MALNAAHGILAATVANTNVATNVDVNGTEPQQHTAVPITTVSPIPKVAGHTARKSHRRGKTCIVMLNPYKREREQKKNTSNKSANEPRPNMNGQAGNRLKSTKPIRPISSKSTSEDATPCLYWCELFSNSKSRERWIKCGVCEAWAREDCGGYEGGAFTCVMCDDQ